MDSKHKIEVLISDPVFYFIETSLNTTICLQMQNERYQCINVCTL